MRHIKEDLYSKLYERETPADVKLLTVIFAQLGDPIVNLIYNTIIQPIKYKSREEKHETL